MVLTDGRDAGLHDFWGDPLRRQLHGVHPVDQSLEAFVGERRLSAVEFYDPLEQKKTQKLHKHRPTVYLNPCLWLLTLWRDSPVQIVERVRDPHHDLHGCLTGQFLDGGVALLPKRLRVVFVGQTGDLPFLKTDKQSCSGFCFTKIWDFQTF